MRASKLISPFVVALASCATFAAPASAQVIRNIVLVHGAYADGSGWRAIADILERDGFKVSVVQEPETSLSADVAAAKLILDQQTGPTVLVGHSYGGAVITEAGNHPRVSRLVYVAAFAPDAGETLAGLSKSVPSIAAKAGDIMPKGGFSFVKVDKFPSQFAADVPLPLAKFMAISQVGQSTSSAMTKIATPAWRSKQSFAVVATEDHMINPDLERKMYARAHAKVTEIKGSHAIYVSQPAAVARVIEEAAGLKH